MKSLKKISILCCFFIFFSCSESLDFNQLDNYNLKPIFTSSLTYFKVTPAKFFDSSGTIQKNSITEITNFDVLKNQFIKDNLIEFDLNVEVNNEFDRNVTINVEFLNSNNFPVYTFSSIFIKRKQLNFKYLEKIYITPNSIILNTQKIKITAELENTGIQMDVNDPSEFEFKSSLTFYLESSISKK